MKGNFRECENICRDLLRDEPAFAPAWNNLALACFEQKEYAKAVEAVDNAAKFGFEPAPEFLEELRPYREQH
jgi:predicted Zn-dependent protease